MGLAIKVWVLVAVRGHLHLGRRGRGGRVLARGSDVVEARHGSDAACAGKTTCNALRAA